MYEEAKKREDRWIERQKKEAEGLKAASQKPYSKDPYVQQKFAKDYFAALSSGETAMLSYDKMSNFSVNLKMRI